MEQSDRIIAMDTVCTRRHIWAYVGIRKRTRPCAAFLPKGASMSNQGEAVLTPEEKLQKIREIVESAPSGPRVDPNKAPVSQPLPPDFFTSKPGFWDEYARVKK